MPTRGSRVARAALLPGLLGLALVAQLELVASQTSVTVDEFAHLPAGLVYWKTGKFSVYHHNPPLARLLAALPLLGQDLDERVLESATNRWRLGLAFMASHGDHYHAIYRWPRRVMETLTLTTAALLFFAAQRSLGYWPAVVALALFAMSPTVLAHGSLVTTDAPFALAFLAVAVAAAAFFLAPTRVRTAGLGLLLGLALLTKFTGLLLPPLLSVVGLALPALAGREPGPAFRWLRLGLADRWGRLLASFALALAVLNAGYLFQGSLQPLASYDLAHPLLARLASSPLGALPLPLPADFVRGFDDQFREASGEWTVYLHGELSNQGWWYYYPVALLLKLPAPLFILLAAVGVALARGRLRPSPLLVGCLGLPLLSLALFAALTRIDIGVRYLLFLLPPLYLAVAHLARPPLAGPRARVALGLCLAWYAGSSLAGYPHYIAYFSDCVGGWRQGHRWLADSNLDWGQDLLRLRAAIDRGEIESVALSYFGLVDPAAYGIAYEPLTAQPRAKTVAISVNHLLGIHPFRRVPAVAPYRTRRPIGRIGASLWLFEPIRAP